MSLSLPPDYIKTNLHQPVERLRVTLITSAFADPRLVDFIKARKAYRDPARGSGSSGRDQSDGSSEGGVATRVTEAAQTVPSMSDVASASPVGPQQELEMEMEEEGEEIEEEEPPPPPPITGTVYYNIEAGVHVCHWSMSCWLRPSAILCVVCHC